MPKEKKQIFGKDVIDIVMVLPKKEGTITGGGLITMRVPISAVTNIEFMSSTFRQMWVTLCREDKILSKEFESYFKNQEIEKKRLEKLMQKMAIKGNTKQSKKIEAKMKQYEKSNNDKTPSNKGA